MATSNRRTTEQKRASNAWDNVAKLESQKDKIKKEYASLARGLPAMIQTNGLGQALAFLKAKGASRRENKNEGDKPHKLIYDHLAPWVYQQLNPNPPQQTNKQTDLLGWLIRQNSDVYRRATREALAYALWLRRFAEAQGWGGEEGQDG